LAASSPERLGDFALRFDFGDHLTVIGGRAEQLDVVRNNGERLRLDRLW